jgi:hypothetical protein
MSIIPYINIHRGKYGFDKNYKGEIILVPFCTGMILSTYNAMYDSDTYTIHLFPKTVQLKFKEYKRRMVGLFIHELLHHMSNITSIKKYLKKHYDWPYCEEKTICTIENYILRLMLITVPTSNPLPMGENDYSLLKKRIDKMEDLNASNI